MNAKLTIVGNLVSTPLKKTKKDGTIYYVVTVAVNVSKEETVYYSCFLYGVSDERAKNLTQGTLIYVYGIPAEKIETNPNTNIQYINRIIQVKDFDILFVKK